jgi:hypothetical protein
MLKSAICASALLLVCQPAPAQVVTGTIQGTVTDASGAVVSGANVTLANTATGFQRKTISSDIGIYSVPFLPTGAYDVQVEMTGFQTVLRKGIEVGADQRVAIDFTLQAGNVTETITVEAAAPLVNRVSSEVGEVLHSRTVVDLPLNGRNFASLVYLTPGVQTGRVGEQAAGGGPGAWRSNIAFNANGMRATTNSYLLDGVDNNELGLDFTISVLPVVDAIQEFKVQTNNFSAEFGRALGGIVNITTRGGTNEIHGGVYEFLRNSALDARNFFAAPGPKPPLRQNQFGGLVGGPIRRNKLFYFVDYQGQRIREAQNFLVTVPSESMKAGDFSGLNTIYDPLSPRSSPVPFPNNRIPEDRVDRASRILTGFYPTQNIARAANNFSNSPRLKRRDDQFDVRFDDHANDRNNYFVRYSFHETSRLNPSALLTEQNPYGGTPGSGQFSGDAGIRAQNVALNFNHVFSPAVVNEFRAGFNRFSITNLPLGFGVNPEEFGIPGLNISTAALAMPIINVAGFGGLGTANVLPDISTSNNFQYLDTISVIKGRHSMRMGASLTRRQRNIFIVPSPSGLFNFNANFTSENGRTGTGHPFASFLLGYPSGTQRSYLLGPQGKRNSEWAGFFQDDIRLGRLSLNLGLRYEVYTPVIEVADRQANLDLQRGVMVPAAENPYGRGLRRTHWRNFGPRFGFAWDVMGSSKTVLRGSYGITYNEELFGLNNFQTLNIPFFIDQTITPGNFTPINRLSDGLQPPVLDASRPSGLIRAINPDFQPASAHMISFNVQRQVTADFALEAGFAGTLGRHLTGFRDINQSRPGTGPANPRRPLFAIAPDIGRVFYTDSRTNSHSEALIIKGTRRLSQGLVFLASYTFGKTIEGQEGTVPGPYVFPMDAQNLDLERAVASFDRRHRFSLSWSYELPFGRGRRFGPDVGGVANAIAGGWQVSGIASISSGPPFPISLNTPVSGSNGFTERPDRIASGKLPEDRRSVERWFDIGAFAIPPVGRFGNAGRNILRASGQTSFDVSAMKAFRFTERVSLQYRAEFYNISNTPQLGLPNGAIGSPGVGSITSTAGNNRQVQMALKLNF